MLGNSLTENNKIDKKERSESEVEMRRTTDDKTLERNYQQKWQFLIRDYELTKRKKHPSFRFVQDFYRHHGTSRQTFNKYYNRYRAENSLSAVLPRKRGPKWQSRRPDIQIEAAVVRERVKGLNKYEIYSILKPEMKEKTPSPSGIYNICKRSGLNRLRPKMKEEKRKIIKEKAGELGHIDCHYLSKDLLVSESKRYYLVCIIDDCTRISWAEVVEDIKSLTVMFAALKSLNHINHSYQIQFEEVISDNGAEFASPKNKEGHPFERMLLELGVKHRYTRPYRPQTNGKVERFWRTLNEDLIEGTTFESISHFKEELTHYLGYYNEIRPHQALNGKTPLQCLQNLSTN